MVDWSDAEIDQLLRCRKSIQDAPRRDMKEEQGCSVLCGNALIRLVGAYIGSPDLKKSVLPGLDPGISRHRRPGEPQPKVCIQGWERHFPDTRVIPLFPELAP
jgi:hypothetical protein